MKRILIFYYLIFNLLLANAQNRRMHCGRGMFDDFYIECSEGIKSDGMLPYTYIFADRDDRNLCFRFSDSYEIEITNRSSDNSQLMFTDIYRIHFENENKEIVIDELLGTNRSDTAVCSVITPFDIKVDANNCCGSIFPLLHSGDVIRIDRDYMFLLITGFTFNVRLYSQTDAEEFEHWYWENMEKISNLGRKKK